MPVALRSLLLALAILGVSCSSGPHGARFDHPPSLNVNPEERTTAAPIDPYWQIEHLSDVLSLRKVIALEQRPGSEIGDVTDITFAGHHWFVLDKMTSTISKFTAEGDFVLRFDSDIPQVGRLNQPRRIRVCYDGLIGVSDVYRGQIFLFDQGGQLVRVVSPEVNEKAYLPRYAFVWNQPDRLVITGFPSNSPSTAEHVIINPSTRPTSLEMGFGARCLAMERAVLKGAPCSPYRAVESVGDQIWCGSPYTTYIDVFDGEGQLLKRLSEQVERPNELLLRPADLKEIDETSDVVTQVTRLLTSRVGNERLIHAGDYVIAQMGPVVDIYRTDGRVMAHNVDTDGLWLNAGADHHLVMVIPAGLDLALLAHGPIRDQLGTAGYNPHGNPHLILFGLVPPSQSTSATNARH